MKVKIKSFWPAAIGLLLATGLFCMPGNEFPTQNWFADIYLDKWIHVGLFAGMVSLFCLPLIYRMSDQQRIRTLFIWIALAMAGYGVIIEFVQGNFIPHRSFGMDDMIANSLGCAIGLIFSNWQLKLNNGNV